MANIEHYLQPKYLIVGGIAVIGGIFLVSKLKPKDTTPAEVLATPIQQPYAVANTEGYTPDQTSGPAGNTPAKATTAPQTVITPVGTQTGSAPPSVIGVPLSAPAPAPAPAPATGNDPRVTNYPSSVSIGSLATIYGTNLDTIRSITIGIGTPAPVQIIQQSPIMLRFVVTNGVTGPVMARLDNRSVVLFNVTVNPVFAPTTPASATPPPSYTRPVQSPVGLTPASPSPAVAQPQSIVPPGTPRYEPTPEAPAPAPPQANVPGGYPANCSGVLPHNELAVYDTSPAGIEAFIRKMKAPPIKHAEHVALWQAANMAYSGTPGQAPPKDMANYARRNGGQFINMVRRNNGLRALTQNEVNAMIADIDHMVAISDGKFVARDWLYMMFNKWYTSYMC